ncbi:unnamed protein product, partial [Tuber aestivum]
MLELALVPCSHDLFWLRKSSVAGILLQKCTTLKTHHSPRRTCGIDQSMWRHVLRNCFCLLSLSGVYSQSCVAEYENLLIIKNAKLPVRCCTVQYLLLQCCAVSYLLRRHRAWGRRVNFAHGGAAGFVW